VERTGVGAVGHRAPMRLLAAAAVATFAVSGVVYGHTSDRPAQPVARAAQSLAMSNLRVERRAPGGRVRASVAASPAGVALEAVARRGARRVGHRTLTAAAGGRTRFSVRLDRASRARLRRVGHLDLKVEVSTSGPGTHLSVATTARVTR
jgi:hypothetical protein